VTAEPRTAPCGPYELVAQREGSLFVRDDNAVEVIAEDPYLVKLAEGADSGILRGALSIPAGGSEGILRFGNFVGRSELGGRSLLVRSRRLAPGATEAMLDEVCAWLSSLPFGIESPARVAYARDRELGPEVLYHAFALLRDAMKSLGPHSLPEALERIISRPHESLDADAPRLVPLGAVSRVDPETLSSIPAMPQLLVRVPADSRLRGAALAKRLSGRMPERVKVRPFLHSTDNFENRFVCGVLETMIDLLRRFERLVRSESRPSAALNAREADGIADYLRRCRRHRALDQLRPLYETPLHSAVLRSRPGYRELMHLHSELLGRSRVEPNDAQRLLESRDAALIYEYWCYVRVVEELESLLGPPLERDRFVASPLQAELRWGYRVRWREVTALYNASFSRPALGEPRSGRDSYSLRMRPDIALRGSGGGLNLFDAKLKLRFPEAAEEGEESAEADGEDSFKPEDLHKMHAYRDALGAKSVWVLYPGRAEEPAGFEAPHAAAQGEGSEFEGVGAIALRPGASHDGGLSGVLGDLV
jgi:uncharacterized protein